MINKVLILISWLVGSVLQSAVASNADIESHKQGIWSIADTEKEKRWIVIHNLDEGKSTGIYHIEVIQKATDAPSWQIVRLKKHIAITAEALKRSIIKPLNKGAVYPEPFNDALAEWERKNGGKGGNVCKSSVIDCIANDP